MTTVGSKTTSESQFAPDVISFDLINPLESRRASLDLKPLDLKP